MNIVFMGTPDFAVPVLDKIIEKGWTVSLVVTQPDRPKGRKKLMTPPPVKEAAEKYGLPVFQPEKIKDDYAPVKEAAPDLIVTAAFGQLLPEAVLEIPPKGAVNVHASLLPKYRGGAPIHEAVIQGEKETGVTIMYMVKKLDAGDMLAKAVVPIDPSDTTGSMHEKLSRAGAELLADVLPEVEADLIEPEAQDETMATYAPNITAEREKIDWSQPAEVVFNQIRGLYPWPVAYTEEDGRRIKIHQAEVSPETTEREPGTVAKAAPEELLIACGNGTCLQLISLQPAGKKQMDAAAFLQSTGWQTGTRLGDDDDRRT
ncbi:methionyl-tRNA formyltransferase [Alkalicoccus chagannorensis]|uniref:methionyl-tRNA formyltransferase n=1 Tax=Alkalicoccus chagannorensis TaxID=427072 RepID=UPI00047BDB36|nr:methionyl-tRNA formyltransferase [Alkalicoccus chagannorensis]